MAKLYSYIIFLCNFFKYCFRIKHSGLFFIKSNSSILGCEKIIFGKKFFANRFLRLEAIGDSKDIILKIGDNVALGESVHIGAFNSIEIKDNVLIGSRVLITDHNHGRYSGIHQSSPFEPPVKRQLFSSGPVVIHENVWIGDGVIILPNVEIGFGTIVAANSVVSKSLPPYCIAAGTPCKVIKKFHPETQLWDLVK
ncbi:LbetaH domain-containing protein [Flavobacterium restrictum]|uniref:Acyltransferase n=1 Tax=Flavobacterium restrictum TaxID=2594428 RepID=A0A553E5J2_9FLAO|nr:acyltransferase [Flavobacterium restrictum]TRX40133.1 acyltransferase [Flavobacterium restrictum]